MHPINQQAVVNRLNRRIFLGNGLAGSLGTMAASRLRAEEAGAPWLIPGIPKAKRVIYLFQSGAPSQMDLFDPKPKMEKHRGEDLPESIRKGQRLTTMTSGQSKFPVAPSVFKFKKHGDSGLWLSDAWRYLPRVADELCMIRTMHTEAINHDPAITFMQTGNQLPGRPSIGAWVTYGLGSPNKDLPGYVVLTSFGSGRPDDQPLYDRLWSAGFLPGKHQGVKFRNKGDAVLYLTDPPGVDRSTRRATLDRLAALNGLHHQSLGDPEIETRVSQYEMAFRMQASVPDLLNMRNETKETRGASSELARWVMIFLSVVRPKGGLRRPGRGLLKKFPEPKTARFNVRRNYRKDVALTARRWASVVRNDSPASTEFYYPNHTESQVF